MTVSTSQPAARSEPATPSPNADRAPGSLTITARRAPSRRSARSTAGRCNRIADDDVTDRASSARSGRRPCGRAVRQPALPAARKPANTMFSHAVDRMGRGVEACSARRERPDRAQRIIALDQWADVRGASQALGKDLGAHVQPDDHGRGKGSSGCAGRRSRRLPVRSRAGARGRVGRAESRSPLARRPGSSPRRRCRRPRGSGCPSPARSRRRGR